ncbi:MAG: UvrD-helicase domain-containing protein [Deltaproteobacteria bacterium]|nr:UvrD-helicase domain-containing protein [Candidatus Anaeroferrophillacea bacterium]
MTSSTIPPWAALDIPTETPTIPAPPVAADILAGLNPGQRQAVTCTAGPLLVLAGAGSGKTRMIVNRIAWLIREAGAAPEEIFAVTFTNKAAGEMRERVAGMIGMAASRLWIGTFHATCARLLRRHGSLLGYSERFIIYDDKDQISLLKEILREMNIADAVLRAETVRAVIDDAKNKGRDSRRFADRAATFQDKQLATIYQLYQERLLACDAMDFGDLLLQTVRLFTDHPEVLEDCRRRFRYILVDEYQDTNEVQYRLLALLASEHRNLCVVGDDDQSIYSWRGARLKNILDFEEDYPEATVIRLEENYRSTQKILAAANRVIAQNRERKGKDLWTRNPEGELLGFHIAADEYDEARFLVRQIRESGRDYADVAVFYRTNAQSRVLEEVIGQAGIPYTIVGGFRFYDRAEIKDLLAYLKVINNPRDAVSLQRIINTPPRGVGKKSVEAVRQWQSGEETGFLDAAREWAVSAVGGGTAAARRAVGELATLLDDLHARRDNLLPSEILKQVIAATGYVDWLLEGSESRHQGESKKENVEELINALATWEQGADAPDLGAWLEDIALVSAPDRRDDDHLARVTLMTLHSAKGLEFPLVFMVGMEEGLFPNRNCLHRDADLEEERRLCYVGMTRAREKLYLVACRSRRFQGARLDNKPSRFLFDIPRELIEVETGGSAGPPPYRRRFAGGGSAAASAGAAAKVRQSAPSTAETTAASVPAAGRGAYPVGSKVEHGVFGPGVVAAVEGAGDDTKLVVIFRDRGRKKISLRYARLTRC